MARSALNLKGREIGMRDGFSLVELLVLIFIIAVLIAILLPTLGMIRKAGRSTVCLANLQQWGQSYQMYLSNNKVRAIPEQTNANTTLRWWEALAPYNDRVKELLLCPEAREQLGLARQSNGTATNAWRRQTQGGDWLGSYGLNVWTYEHRNQGGTTAQFYIRPPGSPSDHVPLLGDCCDPWEVPTTTDPVPRNLSDPEDGITRGLDTYCIDRHRKAVNLLFLDGHVEHVALASLWLFKWSEGSQPQSVIVPRP